MWRSSSDAALLDCASPRSGAGASLNLLPPSVVAGSVRIIEFLLVAVLGFVIYLAYVEREGASTHLIYLPAVLIAATANRLALQRSHGIPAFRSER